jgi:hypothetical protein
LPGRRHQAPPGILEKSLQIKGNSPNCKIDEEKALDVRGARVASIYAGGDGFEGG